jgi:predicted YcjX-like family ATPase
MASRSPNAEFTIHEWSRLMISRAKEKTRSQCAREWLRLLENTNVSGPITAQASNLVTAYVQYGRI